MSKIISIVDRNPHVTHHYNDLSQVLLAADHSHYLHDSLKHLVSGVTVVISAYTQHNHLQRNDKVSTLSQGRSVISTWVIIFMRYIFYIC